MTPTTASTDRAIANVTKAALALLVAFLALCLRAIVLAWGWNRFAVYGLGAPVLAPSMTLGLAFLIQEAMPRRMPAKKSDRTLPEMLGYAVGEPLFAWAILAILWEIAR